MKTKELHSDDIFASEGISLSSLELQIITKLYQPLMGYEAYALYLTLADNFEFNRFKNLVKVMNMNLNKIKANLDILEGLGLLNTYLKKEETYHIFHFIVRKPVNTLKFFNNPLLVNKLAESVGNDFFFKLKDQFAKDKFIKSEYKEITKKYNEVFPLNFDVDLVDEQQAFIVNPVAKIKSDLDFKVLKQALKEYDLQMLLLNNEYKHYFEMLFIEYQLSIDELVEAILVSLVGKEVDLKALENYLKQIKKYREDQCELKKIYLKKLESDNIYDSLSVYEYLQRWQDIYKIDLNDYRKVEVIMNKYPLNNGVYNYLIEALIKKQNSLNITYLEKTAKTWFQKNVSDIKQAQAITDKWGTSSIKNMKNVKTIGSTDNWYQEKEKNKLSTKELDEIKARQAKM